MGEVAFERYRLPTLIGQGGMGKVIAAAAAIALAPFSVVATTPGVAQAAPCAGVGQTNPSTLPALSGFDGGISHSDDTPVLRRRAPIMASPSRVPVLTPQAPPESRRRRCRPHRSFRQVPRHDSGADPEDQPPALGAPRNASLVAPPKALDAPPQAVAAAKAAPATRINPAAPPTPPTQVDFNHQVQNVVNAHSGNVDVVKVDNQALARPRHWDYVDYETTTTARACTTRSIRR